MQSMKAIEIPARGGGLRLVDRPVPQPGSGEVRIKVEACGICHGEVMAMEGHHPRIQYPRVPGHEIVGIIDEVGGAVSGWPVGTRVGVGWSGGRGEVTGLTRDGGYAEYTLAYPEALVRIPDALSPVAAAPLLCAGVTTYTALKHSLAAMGDTVAIQGIGGLGHLALQYARHAGFYTIALSRGRSKEELALKLGAHEYVDGQAEDAAGKLQARGGARVILATAPTGRSLSDLIHALSPEGEMVVVSGGGEPMTISPAQLLNGRRTVRGWTARGASDVQEALQYSVQAGIRPMVEVFPLEQAPQAFEHMMQSEVHFRAVLTMA
jgi:propanol-preferring alcohol dehydrogenase